MSSVSVSLRKRCAPQLSADPSIRKVLDRTLIALPQDDLGGRSAVMRKALQALAQEPEVARLLPAVVGTHQQSTSASAVVPFNPNSWSFSPIPYALGYTPFIVGAVGSQLGYYSPVLLYLFGLLPLLDVLIGVSRANPGSKAHEQALRNDSRFRLLTMLWPLVHVLFLAGALWHMLVQRPENFRELNANLLLLIGSVGTIGAQGITVAHELIHKPGTLEPSLGRFTLALVSYGHFFTEHLRGHHKTVGTPADPASAVVGQTVYDFVPASVVGSFKSAWQIERQRLLRRGATSAWRMDNHVVQSLLHTALVHMSVAGVAWRMTGDVRMTMTAMLFHAMQSVTAFGLLETVNLMEHYGLRRRPFKQLPVDHRPIRYENVDYSHSWNAGHRVTNWFLLQLQRHTDHHAWPGRRYQILRNLHVAPDLPTGYSGMTLMAIFCPWLFRRIMDPRVKALQTKREQYERRASILPHGVPESGHLVSI